MDTKENCCILPEKPKEPPQTDCCGSGCRCCVFDIYKAELVKWEKECERILRGGKPSVQTQLISQLEFKTFKLTGIYPSAKNLNIYRFGVAGGLRLDVKPGQHLMMKGFVTDENKRGGTVKESDVEIHTGNIAKMNEEESSCLEEKKHFTARTFLGKKPISRQYTILNNENGYFDVLIKLYDDGQMSEYIRRLSVEDDVLWRGPFGEYRHHPSYSRGGTKTILALCAGTGISPVYSIAKSIVNDEDDETIMRLLWANHSWEELPLIQEMKELTSYWNFSCRLFLSEGLDGVPSGAKTFYEIAEGKINCEVLKLELDSLLRTEIQVLLCGTPSFEEDITAFLHQLDLKASACHRFL